MIHDEYAWLTFTNEFLLVLLCEGPASPPAPGRQPAASAVPVPVPRPLWCAQPRTCRRRWLTFDPSIVVSIRLIRLRRGYESESSWLLS